MISRVLETHARVLETRERVFETRSRVAQVGLKNVDALRTVTQHHQDFVGLRDREIQPTRLDNYLNDL